MACSRDRAVTLTRAAIDERETNYKEESNSPGRMVFARALMSTLISTRWKVDCNCIDEVHTGTTVMQFIRTMRPLENCIPDVLFSFFRPDSRLRVDFLAK